MQAIHIILCFCGLVAALQDVDEVKQEWLNYKQTYGKRYRNFLEESGGFFKFKENLRIILEHNKLYENGNVSYQMGLNPYSDLSIDDMETFFMGLRMNESYLSNHHNAEPFVPSFSIRKFPTSMDWRTKGAVTPVKNQKQCGSCWAFSTTGALESHHYLKTGILIPLSEQHLVDCDTQSYGCSGGYKHLAFNYIRDNGGICTGKSYPYNAKQGKCDCKRENVVSTCGGYISLPYGNENALLEAVATKGPISVSIDATKYLQNYQNGVFDDISCRNSNTNHAVLLVGYGTENGIDYWLVKNSWGTVWGEQGYIKMSRNKNNQCGIALYGLYPKV